VLYLDAKEKKYLDECGPANFFGIRQNKYVTPNSSSILPSITNMSLRQLAEDMGMEVEVRPVPIEELAEFEEVGACGTAAVISPVKRIYDADMDKEYLYGKEPGKISVRLYEKLRGIQYGTEPDPYGWTEIVE
jgi:branched-chain amino acid aminotransferase